MTTKKSLPLVILKERLISVRYAEIGTVYTMMICDEV